MSDVRLPCQGRRCDHIATGIWLCTLANGTSRLVRLCGTCGLHDVLRGLRAADTKYGTIWQPATTRLIQSITAQGSPTKAAQLNNPAAKHWVEPVAAKPVVVGPTGYRLREIKSATPTRPFIFTSLKEGGVI